MSRAEYDKLEQALGHRFNQAPHLLRQALTHRSFSSEHNERLEFLGDAVLGLAVSSLLYERLGDLPEGDLSRVRSNLVCEASLHRIAEKLSLSPMMQLGQGEAKSGGRKRASILADAVEALLGAVYLDAGYEAAQKVVARLFEGIEIRPDMKAAAKDGKTALQEWLQARRLPVPEYSVAEVRGAAHQQTFFVTCMIAPLRLASKGEGTSRRSAEQSAASAMLKILQTAHPEHLNLPKHPPKHPNK